MSSLVASPSTVFGAARSRITSKWFRPGTSSVDAVVPVSRSARERFGLGLELARLVGAVGDHGRREPGRVEAERAVLRCGGCVERQSIGDRRADQGFELEDPRHQDRAPHGIGRAVGVGRNHRGKVCAGGTAGDEDPGRVEPERRSLAVQRAPCATTLLDDLRHARERGQGVVDGGEGPTPLRAVPRREACICLRELLPVPPVEVDQHRRPPVGLRRNDDIDGLRRGVAVRDGRRSARCLGEARPRPVAALPVGLDEGSVVTVRQTRARRVRPLSLLVGHVPPTQRHAPSSRSRARPAPWGNTARSPRTGASVGPAGRSRAGSTTVDPAAVVVAMASSVAVSSVRVSMIDHCLSVTGFVNLRARSGDPGAWWGCTPAAAHDVRLYMVGAARWTMRVV